MKKVLIAGGLSSVLLIAGSGSLVSAKTGFPHFFHRHGNKSIKDTKTKITMEQAEEIALKRVPGTVENSKTETQKGKTVYYFEIRDNKGMKEMVWVGDTGKIKKVEKEKSAKQMKSKTT